MEEDVSRLRLCTLRGSLGYRMEGNDVEIADGLTPKGCHDMSTEPRGRQSIIDMDKEINRLQRQETKYRDENDNLRAKLKEADWLLNDILFVEWHGAGELERDEFYCPWCSAHSLDSDKIPHEEHCGFYKIRKYLDDVKGKE